MKEGKYPSDPFEMSYVDMVKHVGYKRGKSNGDEIYRIRDEDHIVNGDRVLKAVPPTVNVLTDEEVERLEKVNIMDALEDIDADMKI